MMLSKIRLIYPQMALIHVSELLQFTQIHVIDVTDISGHSDGARWPIAAIGAPAGCRVRPSDFRPEGRWDGVFLRCHQTWQAGEFTRNGGVLAIGK